MVFVLSKCFRVVECRVVVFHHDGISLGFVPQTIADGEQSLFPECSGSSLTLISLIFGLVCQVAVCFAGCQLLAHGLNGLGPSVFGQSLAKCHVWELLRHSYSRILL